MKLTNCIYCDALAAQASFLVWVNLQTDLLSSEGLNQGAASNRLSKAHTEWLRAQIWSKKWRFAEWSWATAESELFDSGSKMSGRSKCTAGEDEESTKRVPVTSILQTASHSPPHLYQSRIYRRPSFSTYLKLKCHSIKDTLEMSMQSGSYRSPLTATQRF